MIISMYIWHLPPSLESHLAERNFDCVEWRPPAVNLKSLLLGHRAGCSLGHHTRLW